MIEESFPVYPEQLTPDFLNRAIGELYPETSIAKVELVDAKGFGSTNVSTSANVTLDIGYTSNPFDLPRSVVGKMVKTDDWPAQGIAADPANRQRPPRSSLYRNEVEFYRNLGRDVPVDLPRIVAAEFDDPTNRYLLLFENLAVRNATFPSQYFDATLEDMKTLLTALARLHARYWQSPRFETDLAWVETSSKGDVADMLHGPVRAGVADELSKFKFKRELVDRIGSSEEKLFAGLAALQAHQMTLPTTLVHGDAHLGNTFRLPDSNVGFYDWQLVARGFCMHDVTYLIITTLSIAQRRRHERDMLRFYRECLLENGVADAPREEMLWLEYRRAAHWCVTIGWLPCPANAYGWELMVLANQRTFTAYEDLETADAIDDLL